MFAEAPNRFPTPLAVWVLAGTALSGCVAGGDGGGELAISGPQNAAETVAAIPNALGVGLSVVEIARRPQNPEPGSVGERPSPDQVVVTPEATSLGSPWSGGTGSSSRNSGEEVQPVLGKIAATHPGTEPGSLRLSEPPNENPLAADLLNHWGHRRIQGIVEGLSLSSAAPSADGADFKLIRTAVQSADETAVVPELEDDDELPVLGSRHGVTYGRWKGGPADTLSIEFDLSRAGSMMRDDPAFLALLERSGKAWSRRIADTWASWERAPGDYKGALWNDDRIEAEVRVGPAGETSDRLEIDIKDNELADAAGRGGHSGGGPPGRSLEPRFGNLQIDREYLRDAGEASLFHVLTHEIGHVLGAWWGEPESGRYGIYTDEATGTWTGPNVVAVHGRAAPFQDDADPFTWVNGERSPQAKEFDFLHSGVCSSVMAYCGRNDPRPALLPHEIDFAFLADLGMTVIDETDRPETYGLLGWTDHAGFSLSVSRDLQFAIGQSGNSSYSLHSSTFDVTDLLQVEVDVFGLRSTGDLRQSYAAAGLSGTVRYAGGLLGSAIDRTGLPPVTGDASLAVNLGSLDGTASFTSLQVHTRGITGIFSGGSLHYPFELSANAIVGTGTGSTLRADFYGPRHESVAGALHDPTVGLLASFGAAHDGRPGREDVIASAGHLLGTSHWIGSADAAADGWSQYRCATASACDSRHSGSEGWSDWTTTTRSKVLAATAGWSWRKEERPLADRDIVRIARYSAEFTDGLQGLHAVVGYTGTLEHVAFGTGFERYTNWSSLSKGAKGTENSFNKWAGVQGTLSTTPPQESVRWSGLMLGYQSWSPAGQPQFVEGLENLEFSLSDNSLDVTFSDVATRDGQRTLRDIAFQNLEVEEDGTFRGDGAAGAMDGAFFGSSQVEAAGAFRHNASNVIGSFGARRLPDTVTLAVTEPVAKQPLIVDLDDTLHIGADVASALGQLPTAGDYSGVSVSSGLVQDGVGAAAVLEYLKQHMGQDYDYGTTGLATFPDFPTVRLAEGTSAEFSGYVENAIQLINSALPYGRHIMFGSEPASPMTALEDVPDGEIFVDFAPSAEDWDLEGGNSYHTHGWSVAQIDPISEYNAEAKRWEDKRMRAGHIWFDSGALEAVLNTAWVQNPDTREWERKLLESRVVETGTVQSYYRTEYVPTVIVYGLFRALGFLHPVDHAEFPNSILRTSYFPNIEFLPAIDGEALLAAYTRLVPGTQPQDLSAESLGPWDDTSFHLKGDLHYAGGEAGFGVALRNGLARSWASGTTPLAALENNSALYGTISWNGAILGITPSEETVAGQARLTVELSTLDSHLDFTGLEHWGVKKAPGEVGNGTTWGDGDLKYAIEVQGNSFSRTGGDDGEVAGTFFGTAHEAMGGVVERSDLVAGFGGLR